jgi:hypothetical protein
MPSASPVMPATSSLPVPVQRYVLTGEDPNSLKRDVVTVTNQVPRWAYAGTAALAFWMAWKAYKEWKAKQRGGNAPAG